MSRHRAVILGGCILLFAAGLGAQQAGSADPIRELLVEVRGLRAAMERSATVGARVQLLVARIQLQEQRIAELSRRVTAIRSELRGSEREALQIGAMFKMFEQGAADAKQPEEREAAHHQLTMMKNQAADLERRRLELAQEEAFLTQQLNDEQGRWSTINEQLDQLERSLATGK
jgi:hypothetical protein